MLDVPFSRKVSHSQKETSGNKADDNRSYSDVNLKIMENNFCDKRDLNISLMRY